MAQRSGVQGEPALLPVRELDADQDVGERLSGTQRPHGRVLVVGDEEAVGVAGVQLVAEHGVEALADHDAPAQDALRGPVGRGDDALVVADDDALLEGGDDCGVALLERAARGFGAPALGDVGAHGDRAGDLVVLVEHERDRDADLEQGPVGTAVHGLEMLRRLETEARVRAHDVGELLADDRVLGPAVHLFGRGVPAVDPALGVETDDRVGDVLDELGLVAQRLLGLPAQGEVAQDHLVRGAAVPLGADAEGLDDDVRAVDAHERGFGRLGRGFVLLQRRDPLERLEQRVGVDELRERLAQVLVEVGDPDEVGRGLVGPADQPVLVHDDAVGAQLEQQSVAVGLLLEGPLGLTVAGDVRDDADAARDRAAGAEHRPGAHEQRPFLAVAVEDDPLELVVVPGAAAFDDGDDGIDEPGRRDPSSARRRAARTSPDPRRGRASAIRASGSG